MEALYDRCAGLDVHKKSVSSCIRITNGNRMCKERLRSNVHGGFGAIA